MKTPQPGASTDLHRGTEPEPARRGQPLRRYLLGLIALFVAAAATSVGFGWIQAEREGLAATRRDADYEARLAARLIGEQLSVVRGAVAQLARNPGMKRLFDDPESCNLNFSLPGGAVAGHLDVLGPDGTVVCSSQPPAAAERGRYATAPWLPAASDTAQLAAPVIDERTGRRGLLITAPIAGLGLVAAFVDLPTLGVTASATFSGARDLEVLVSSADGTQVLSRWPDGDTWTGRAVAGTAFLGPTTAGEGRDVTGMRRVYGQAVVPDLGWRVYVGAARGPALEAAHRLAQRQAVVAGVGLVAGLLATYLVYRRITRPIRQLRTAVRAATNSGEMPGTVAVGGPREVTDLGREFGNLLAAVRHQLAERRRAEETAQEHERNYRQMFDTNPYPMYLFDAETLAIVEANDAAVAFYGHPRQTLLSMTVTGLGPPEDAAALAEASATAEPVVRAPAPTAEPVERAHAQRQVKHDGTVVEVTITSHRVSFAGRWVRCAVIEDVTEREHLERRLRQSQRLESLGQLAGGVAHDFNNLLGIILGYAAMSAADVEAAAAADPKWRALHDDLEQIVAAGDRATALTRQLLSFARADAAAEPRVLDLNDVVADMQRLLDRTLGEDIALLTHLTAASAPIKADPGQLEQVLLNLAVNARDAMPSGGTLTIDTEAVSVDAHYAAQHPGLRVGQFMALRVSDTGTGMSKATVDRAFEPFFTTKPKGHGTGLGLATIYGIVTQAGGHAQIYSEPGRGTTVTALLPTTDESADPVHEPTGATDHGDGQTILLVEDDEGLRALTERILTRHGYAVLAAATCSEAQRLAAAEHHIDLLLTDVVMPEMDGHTLATSLQAVHPTMTVIYTSGYTETILAARSTLPSGVTLLNKPVSANRLLAAVARSIGLRQEAATP